MTGLVTRNNGMKSRGKIQAKIIKNWLWILLDYRRGPKKWRNFGRFQIRVDEAVIISVFSWWKMLMAAIGVVLRGSRDTGLCSNVTSFSSTEANITGAVQAGTSPRCQLGGSARIAQWESLPCQALHSICIKREAANRAAGSSPLAELTDIATATSVAAIAQELSLPFSSSMSHPIPSLCPGRSSSSSMPLGLWGAELAGNADLDF